MDIILISKEDNKLHISTDGLYSDYTVYDKDGMEIDGGFLLGKVANNNINKLVSCVISMAKGITEFSSPYQTLKGERATELLEELQERNFNDMVKQQKEIDEIER